MGLYETKLAEVYHTRARKHKVFGFMLQIFQKDKYLD